MKQPRKSSHPVLLGNYELSLSRLGSNLRRLRQQPEVLREYDNMIKDQMERGIVEDIAQVKLAPPSGKGPLSASPCGSET